MTTIEDYNQSNFCQDKITAFSVRPPELLCLDEPGPYLQMTRAEKLPIPRREKRLSRDVKKCEWIDGLGRRIRLRPHYVSVLTQNLRELVASQNLDEDGDGVSSDRYKPQVNSLEPS